MDTTSYGLFEGLLTIAILIPIIVVIWVLRYKTHRSHRKKISLIYGSIVLCILLDTAMWVFNIETGILDYKVNLGGSLEQVTIFAIIAFVLVLYSTFMKLENETSTGDNIN